MCTQYALTYLLASMEKCMKMNRNLGHLYGNSKLNKTYSIYKVSNRCNIYQLAACKHANDQFNFRHLHRLRCGLGRHFTRENHKRYDLKLSSLNFQLNIVFLIVLSTMYCDKYICILMPLSFIVTCNPYRMPLLRQSRWRKQRKEVLIVHLIEWRANTHTHTH